MVFLVLELLHIFTLLYYFRTVQQLSRRSTSVNLIVLSIINTTIVILFIIVGVISWVSSTDLSIRINLIFINFDDFRVISPVFQRISVIFTVLYTIYLFFILYTRNKNKLHYELKKILPYWLLSYSKYEWFYLSPPTKFDGFIQQVSPSNNQQSINGIVEIVSAWQDHFYAGELKIQLEKADINSELSETRSMFKVCLPLLSPYSWNDPQFQETLNHALRDNTPIIPVMIDDTSVPSSLGNLNWIDLRHDMETGVENLIYELKGEHDLRSASEIAPTRIQPRVVVLLFVFTIILGYSSIIIGWSCILSLWSFPGTVPSELLLGGLGNLVASTVLCFVIDMWRQRRVSSYIVWVILIIVLINYVFVIPRITDLLKYETYMFTFITFDVIRFVVIFLMLWFLLGTFGVKTHLIPGFFISKRYFYRLSWIYNLVPLFCGFPLVLVIILSFTQFRGSVRLNGGILTPNSATIARLSFDRPDRWIFQASVGDVVTIRVIPYGPWPLPYVLLRDPTGIVINAQGFAPGTDITQNTVGAANILIFGQRLNQNGKYEIIVDSLPERRGLYLISIAIGNPHTANEVQNWELLECGDAMRYFKSFSNGTSWPIRISQSYRYFFRVRAWTLQNEKIASLRYSRSLLEEQATIPFEDGYFFIGRDDSIVEVRVDDKRFNSLASEVEVAIHCNPNIFSNLKHGS